MSGNTRGGNQQRISSRVSRIQERSRRPTSSSDSRCTDSPHKAGKYQTIVWNKALEPCPSLPKPEDSGWYYSEGLLKPKLITREEVSPACLQLAYCGCSREGECCVNRRCTCVKISLSFSKACKCGDRCRNDRNTAAEANEA